VAISALRHERTRREDVPILAPWVEAWTDWVGAIYLRAYLDTAGDAAFIPKEAGDIRTLLDFCTVEKCIYELNYELNNRPEWADIPLRGLVSLRETGAK
jgi:maltose alpha-D-glucosyltransferase/alpha-amylase